MSEKEYYVTFFENLGYVIYRQNNEYVVVVDKKYQACKICELLNDFHEDNEELKQVLQDYQDIVFNFFIQHESEFSQELKDEITLLFDIEWDW